MRKKKPKKTKKFEFSDSLAEATKQARATAGFTQDQVSARTGIDKRTVLNMENGNGNPTMEKLYPVVRLYGMDPRPIFFPEKKLKDPARENLRLLLETCTEKEAAALTPILRVLLDVIRSKDSIECQEVPDEPQDPDQEEDT